jgi:hypothetical protein
LGSGVDASAGLGLGSGVDASGGAVGLGAGVDTSGGAVGFGSGVGASGVGASGVGAGSAVAIGRSVAVTDAVGSATVLEVGASGVALWFAP